MLKEDFIKKSITIHGDMYDYSLVEYVNNKTKVKIICPTHGLFEQRPINHTVLKQGCKKCSTDKSSIEYRKDTSLLIEQFNKVHKNKYDYSKVIHKNNLTKIIIICPIHGEFLQTPKNHINNHGCPECAYEIKRQKLSTGIDNFVINAKKIHGDKYLYDNAHYFNNKTVIAITCKKHGTFLMTPSHHLSGHGCQKCSGTYRPTNDEFKEICSKIHNNLYDYSLVKFKNYKSRVDVICEKHGKFSQIAEHHKNGSGCPLCYESKGELAIRTYLESNNIDYVPQKKFEDCKNVYRLPFDFYLIKENICIEFDGIQHFQEVKKFKRCLKEVQKLDNIKTNYCINNNIKLLRIKYDQIKNIKNILDLEIMK